MNARNFATVVLCAAAGVLSAQQPRDAGAVPPSGTATIAGQVVTEETPPRGIGRAIVMIGGDVLGGRSAITDDDGRFVFANLPAGQFTISAAKAAYLPAAYGARRPGRPGTAIVLTDGAQQNVLLRMARGAVISGTIRDPSGNPLPGIEVTAVNIRNTGRQSRAMGTNETPTTDDRGMYRIYGLLPDDYQVRATLTRLQIGGQGPIGARSTTEMDALLATLGRRAAGQTTGLSAPASLPPLPIAPAVGFHPTYFPGTPIPADAETITVAAGEERTGVDFEVRPVQAGAIAGHVSGPVANLGVVQLSIFLVGSTSSTAGDGSTNPILSERPTAQNGAFRYANVTPGKYRIVARADGNQTAPPQQQGRATFSVTGGASANADYLYAVAEVDALGGDTAGVSLSLQPASTFSGRIAFDATTEPIPADLSGFRVSISAPSGTFSSMSGGTLVGNSFQAGAFALTQADGSFVIRNVAPGAYGFNVILPAAISAKWVLRSAMAGERDVLDGPLEIVSGVNITNAQVTLTDRHTELSGTLQTAAGAPAPDYFMVMFPGDKSLWRASRRIRSTRPSNDGKFVFRDLPAGDYLLAALTDVEQADLDDAKFLEEVAPAALRVTLAHGEMKTQDVMLR